MKKLIDNLILLLSYFDNLHDFGELCVKENKNVCEELYNNYKNILKNINKQIEKEILKLFKINTFKRKVTTTNFI